MYRAKNLLIKLNEMSRCYSLLHDAEARLHLKWHKRLNTSIDVLVLIQVVLGGVEFVTLLSKGGFSEFVTDLVMNMIKLVFALVLGVSRQLFKAREDKKLGDQHKLSADNFKELSDDVMEMIVKGSNDHNRLDEVAKLFDRYRAIEKSAPYIRDSIREAFLKNAEGRSFATPVIGDDFSELGAIMADFDFINHDSNASSFERISPRRANTNDNHQNLNPIDESPVFSPSITRDVAESEFSTTSSTRNTLPTDAKNSAKLGDNDI